jgi:hypothetical protein
MRAVTVSEYGGAPGIGSEAGRVSRGRSSGRSSPLISSLRTSSRLRRGTRGC